MATTPISANGKRVSKAEWGSDVIVEAIRDLGIEYIALNPGASFRGIHDSLVNWIGQGNKPEMILCNHEEIAVAIARATAAPPAGRWPPSSPTSSASASTSMTRWSTSSP